MISLKLSPTDRSFCDWRAMHETNVLRQMCYGKKKNTRPINMSRFINGTAAATVRGKNNPKRLRHLYFTNLFLHTTATGHRRVCVVYIISSVWFTRNKMNKKKNVGPPDDEWARDRYTCVFETAEKYAPRDDIVSNRVSLN